MADAVSHASSLVISMSEKTILQFPVLLPYLKEIPSWNTNMKAVAEDVQKVKECVPLLDGMCKALGIEVPRLYVARMELIMFGTIMGAFEPQQLINAARELITANEWAATPTQFVEMLKSNLDEAVLMRPLYCGESEDSSSNASFTTPIDANADHTADQSTHASGIHNPHQANAHHTTGFCMHCGAKWHRGGAFCITCGKPAAPKTPQRQVQLPPHQDTPDHATMSTLTALMGAHTQALNKILSKTTHESEDDTEPGGTPDMEPTLSSAAMRILKKSYDYPTSSFPRRAIAKMLPAIQLLKQGPPTASEAASMASSLSSATRDLLQFLHSDDITPIQQDEQAALQLALQPRMTKTQIRALHPERKAQGKMGKDRRGGGGSGGGGGQHQGQQRNRGRGRNRHRQRPSYQQDKDKSDSQTSRSRSRSHSRSRSRSRSQSHAQPGKH